MGLTLGVIPTGPQLQTPKSDLFPNPNKKNIYLPKSLKLMILLHKFCNEC